MLEPWKPYSFFSFEKENSNESVYLGNPSILGADSYNWVIDLDSMFSLNNVSCVKY